LKSAAFVQESFRDYYEDFSLKSRVPAIQKREFGFISFEGWMQRHKGFQNEEELTSFLKGSVPRDSYVSCAYYEDPLAEMDRKGWLGADLIFDIDADHIPTPCNKIHDEWMCSDCGFAGRGITPEKCPSCGGEKFNTSTWPCEICLESAKAETVKLLDALAEDFGFSQGEVHTFYSGHRGYHVHVESKAVETLDAVARKEIVDYVSGLGLEPSFYGLDEKNPTVANLYQELTLDDFGWRRRMAAGVKAFILGADEQGLVNSGIGKRETKAILQNRDSFVKRWQEKGAMGIIRGVGSATWNKILEQGIGLQSARIDTVVTTDIHRLIRLQDTLHGKTGFKKAEFPASSINDFDPFKSAIAFKGGAATVFVSNSPEFKLGGRMFGPYKNQKVELPTAAAVFLVCRGRAEVVE
jgi:DNA primase small subunit